MRPKLIIVGGGASALMLASEIDTKKYEVSLFESNKTLGRKFLVAGDGGLNLTHSEIASEFIKRYTPSDFLKEAFQFFSNHDLINWFHHNGIETFVGSSKRVFPKKGIKPIEVLKMFSKKIENNKVNVFFEHELIDFNGQGEFIFKNQEQEKVVKSDIVVFCLGGASWPITGSKGNYLHMFQKHNIQTEFFQASNCAYHVNWPSQFIQKHHGAMLKNCQLRCGEAMHLGEVVLTHFGIEGSGIYPLSPAIRKQLKEFSLAQVFIDLKPQLSADEIKTRINVKAGKNLSAALNKQLKLTAAQIAMMKAHLTKDDFLNIDKLSLLIKNFPIQIISAGPIQEAISTVGGISLNAIDESYALKNLKNHFVIGEMLDYDATTGGYLLQSCFSMAKFLAQTLNSKAHI